MKAKKRAAKREAPGMSRGYRGMFLRLPLPTYQKLHRLMAATIAGGDRASIQSTVVKLVNEAPEPS